MARKTVSSKGERAVKHLPPRALVQSGLVRKEADVGGREAFRASREVLLARRRKGLGVSLSLSRPLKIWRQSYP